MTNNKDDYSQNVPYKEIDEEGLRIGDDKLIGTTIGTCYICGASITYGHEQYYNIAGENIKEKHVCDRCFHLAIQGDNIIELIDKKLEEMRSNNAG